MRRHLWTFFFSPHHAQHDHALWFTFGNSRTQTQCKIQPARLDDWGIYLSTIPKLQELLLVYRPKSSPTVVFVSRRPSNRQIQSPQQPSPSPGAIMCHDVPKKMAGYQRTQLWQGLSWLRAWCSWRGKTTWLIQKNVSNNSVKQDVLLHMAMQPRWICQNSCSFLHSDVWSCVGF